MSWEGMSSLSSTLFKLDILSYRVYGLGRWNLKSRWDLDKPGK